MQQVRVQVFGKVFSDIEYLFSAPASKWIPELNDQKVLRMSSEFDDYLSTSNRIPNREDVDWFHVSGLQRAEPDNDERNIALSQMTPSAGSYVMISLRHRIRG